MIKCFLEITMAMLTVYGLYCLILNMTYILFCRDKRNICIAFFKKKNTDIFSDILLAKKMFMGRTRTIILLDFSVDGVTAKNIAQRNKGCEIYRAERIDAE